MSRVTRSAIAVGLALATAIGGYAISGAQSAGAQGALGPGLVTVRVNVHYSHFSISDLHVRPGTTVRFLVRNQDPIAHEFIVGDARVHARHAKGKHPAHPPVPGEVSVRPGEEGETFYRFGGTGKVLFACHLPGHLAFGMRGWVVVSDA